MEQAKGNVVVVGASAGGLEVLITLVESIPRDLPAALLLVLHLPTSGPSYLREILGRHSVWPVQIPGENEPLVEGRIFIAPSDRHLVVRQGEVGLTLAPKENGFRPSIDVLFRSAALAYGPRVVGVLVSGLLDDGVAGLMDIKRQGGRSVIQEPKDALFPSMVNSALRNVPIDASASSQRLASAIERQLALMAQLPRPQNGDPPLVAVEETAPSVFVPDRLTVLTCPDCHGVLWETEIFGAYAGYRCHTGHRYSSFSLAAGQAMMLEKALREAHRAAKERVFLSQNLVEKAKSRGSTDLVASLTRRMRQEERRVQLILDAIALDVFMDPSEHSTSD